MRLIAVLAGSLATILGIALPAAAAPNLHPGYAKVFTYNGPHHSAVCPAAQPELHPTAGIHRATTHRAVDSWSRGTSAYPRTPSPRGATTYVDHTLVAQGDSAGTTTRVQVRRTARESWPSHHRRVAANAGSRLLSPSSLADEVVNATGGVLKTNKGGFTVEIPHGARGITVRVMERGGSRTNYYRVSVPGKETYTVAGEASTDAALTHIGITESSLDDILSIVARIQRGG